MDLDGLKVVVRGAGDIGSAVAHRLFRDACAVVIHEEPLTPFVYGDFTQKLVRLRDFKLQHVPTLRRSARFIGPRPSQAIIT